MTRSRMIVAALVLAALVLATLAPGHAVSAAEPDGIKIGEFIAATPPQPAPQISFTDMAGNEVSLADFKGRFVVLNLWATWCQPCLKEMPSLEAFQAKLAPALTVLAISEDRGGAATVEPFAAKLGVDKVKLYLDPKSAVGRAFHARGLPTSIVIDGDGTVLGRVEGAAEWDSDEFQATLAKLMPPKPPGG